MKIKEGMLQGKLLEVAEWILNEYGRQVHARKRKRLVAGIAEMITEAVLTCGVPDIDETQTVKNFHRDRQFIVDTLIELGLLSDCEQVIDACREMNDPEPTTELSELRSQVNDLGNFINDIGFPRCSSWQGMSPCEEAMEIILQQRREIREMEDKRGFFAEASNKVTDIGTLAKFLDEHGYLTESNEDLTGPVIAINVIREAQDKIKRMERTIEDQNERAEAFQYNRPSDDMRALANFLLDEFAPVVDFGPDDNPPGQQAIDIIKKLLREKRSTLRTVKSIKRRASSLVEKFGGNTDGSNG